MSNKYEYINPVNTTKLMKEIKATNIGTKIDYINSDGDNVSIFTKEALTTQEEVDLAAIVNAHVSFDQIAHIKNLLVGAMEFGKNTMLEFATENVAMGITQAGKTKAVLEFLTPVKNAMDTGSLHAVIEEIDNLIEAGIPADLAPFVTDERLTEFKNKVEDYLG